MYIYIYVCTLRTWKSYTCEGVNESQHASFLSSPQEKWYLFGIPNFHTQLSHLSYTFTPTSFYTRHLLHQPAFTRDTFYTNQLLHQTPFTIFHTRHALHQTPLTRGNFLHHKSFYTRHLLHQTPFTPNTLYIYRLLHHTFHTKHLLHQAPFTLPQAGRPRWIRASDPNAPYQNCLVVQTAARHSKPPP